MCTQDQHNDEMTRLDAIEKLLTPKRPVDQNIQISSTEFWTVDYRGFKHVFLWLPTSQTLSFGDYGSGVVPAQVWTNLGLQPGTPMLAPNATSGTILVKLRFTDEVIP